MSLTLLHTFTRIKTSPRSWRFRERRRILDWDESKKQEREMVAFCSRPKTSSLKSLLRICHYCIFARVPPLALHAYTQVSSMTQLPQVPYSSELRGPELAIASFGFVWRTRCFPDFARVTNDSYSSQQEDSTKRFSTDLSPDALIVLMASFLLFPRIIRRQSPLSRFQIRNYRQARKVPC